MEIDTVQWNTTSVQTLSAGHGKYNEQSMKKLISIMESKKIIFLAVPAFVYLEWVPMISHVMSNRFNSVSYVSLVWSPNVVLNNFKEFTSKTNLSIPPEKFFFLDGQASNITSSEVAVKGGIMRSLCVK